MNQEDEVIRACGTRDQGGLYIRVKEAFNGKPIDYFLKDPAIEWNGSNVLRSPQLVNTDKGTHLVLGIGKTNYPFPADFIEEARMLGISRKISKDFNFSPLKYGASKLAIMHPRAIPDFKYETESICFKERKKRLKKEPLVNFGPMIQEKIKSELHKSNELEHECLGATYPLSVLKQRKNKHDVEYYSENWAKVNLPSNAFYSTKIPQMVQKEGGTEGLPWKPGIIGIFPAFHFEFIDEKGRKPPELDEKISKQGFDLKVKPR